MCSIMSAIKSQTKEKKEWKRREENGRKRKEKGAKERENSKIFLPQSPAALDAQLPLGYRSIAAEAFVCSSHGGCSAPAVEKLWLHHCLSFAHPERWQRRKGACAHTQQEQYPT
jgi:hypothetical protein